MRSLSLRVVAAVVAVGAFAAAAVTSQFGFVALGMVAALLLATSFSVAGGLSGALQHYRGQPVDVRVWGAPLPVATDAELIITSIRALGAGLHIYFRLGAGGAATHLKVAQPSNAQLSSKAATIGSAKYVQWSGKTVPHVAGVPAVAILIRSSGLREPPRSVA